MLGRQFTTALLFVVVGAVNAARAAEEPAAPMTNDDVIKLVQLGFGEDVVIAKVEAAGATDFRTDVADLEKLKAAGVSQPILAAMIRRGAAHAPAVPPPPPGMPNVVWGAGVPQVSDADTVFLAAKDLGEVQLRSMAGTMSTTYAYVTVLMHCNYAGLQADVRTRDRRPSLLVRSAKNPKGRLYYVVAERDDDDGVRSVKMGNARMFRAKNIGAPDSDNQIEFDAREDSPNVWRLTPKSDLKPGEYGLWSITQEMFDFGVD